MLDERTKERLRRRSEAPSVDIERLYATAATEGAKRRRRRHTATIAACVLLVAVGTAVLVSTRSSSSPTHIDVPPAGQGHDATGVQFRPVLGSVPAGGEEDESAASVVPGCDVNAVMALGASAPTTQNSQLVEGGCALLKDSTSDSRVLLGPVALDGSSIRTATKNHEPGSGWGVRLTLTNRGLSAFNALADAQFHRQFGVVADGELVATPAVEPMESTFRPFSARVFISVSDRRAAEKLAQSVASKPEPGAALASTGPADCSTTTKPGWEVTLATRVTGGHTICVTQRDTEVSYYFDGRRTGGGSGTTLDSAVFTGLGTIDGRPVVFGNLPRSASSVLLTSCTGPKLLVRPLNREQPRYVAATIDEQKLGPLFPNYADDEGKPLAPVDPRRSACKTLGRTTTTHK